MQNSNRIICSAVFGFDEKMSVRPSLRFSQNNLVISSVDIQSVEPVDQRTRDALQKSVQLAIEITTNSQEAAARSVNAPRTGSTYSQEGKRTQDGERTQEVQMKYTGSTQRNTQEVQMKYAGSADEIRRK